MLISWLLAGVEACQQSNVIKVIFFAGRDGSHGIDGRGLRVTTKCLLHELGEVGLAHIAVVNEGTVHGKSSQEIKNILSQLANPHVN